MLTFFTPMLLAHTSTLHLGGLLHMDQSDLALVMVGMNQIIIVTQALDLS